MYKHGPPVKPTTMLVNAETEIPLPRPQTFAGSLRVDRSFGVSHPNEPLAGTTRDTSMPTPEGGLAAKDEVVLRLSRLQPENESQRERRGILLGELSAVLEQIAALTEEVNTQRHSRLAVEHRQIRIEGRKAERELERAANAFTSKDVYALNVMSAQETQRINLEHLRDMEERGEHLGRFHSDRELKDWQQRVSDAKDLYRSVSAMAEEAVNDRAAAQQALQEAREEVGRLASEESRIRSELRGLPHWDPELGLGEPGAGVMTAEIVRTMSRDE